MKQLNKQIFFCLILLLSSCLSQPQNISNEINPFKPLLDFVNENRGWALNHKGQSEIFNKIRIESGMEFEKELIEFVGKDLDRIYWCGNFLISDTYLNGNSPMYELGLKIFEMGLSLNTNPDSDDMNEMNLVAGQLSLKVVSSILLYKLNQTEKAKEIKIEIEELLEKYPIYFGAFPALIQEDREIYDHL